MRSPGRVVVAVALTVTGCTGRVDRFVTSKDAVIVLAHVRVIDGSGGAGRDDQILVIRQGRIADVGRSGSIPVPTGARVFDMTGRTAMPGLIGMHDHLFYQFERSGSVLAVPAQATFAKLYLASGVTTIRTTGTVDFDGDVLIKKRVDDGNEPGPKIHVTGPYLYGIGAEPHPAEIARQVLAAADRGATSVKAYTTLRSSELWAAIQAARARRMRVTGHLCAVGFREAVSLGIDNLEHGLFVDTEFYSGKRPDQCPDQGRVIGELISMDVNGPEIQRTIREIIGHGVAVTSTLSVLESFTRRASSDDPRTLTVFSSGMQKLYLAARDAQPDPDSPVSRSWMKMLVKEMQFERAFVARGGRLIAGVDPTGWGGVVAGFGDQRELELLVEAGLSPEAAIKVATSNGAAFLGERAIGMIAPGLQADLVVVRGNPSRNISDVRNVEMVFKDGVAYDPDRLIRATDGTLTQYDMSRLFRWPWNAIFGTLLACLVARRLWRLSRPIES